MKIAFVTTQSISQSTVIGRVLPLAGELQKNGHQVTVLIHEENESSSRARPGIHVDLDSGSPLRLLASRGAARAGTTTADINRIITGSNPFTRTKDGKQRQSGIYLLVTMNINALRAAWGLIVQRPDVIIIVKPLPENTLAVSIAKLFLWKSKIILDVDDFELFANNLSSLFQRAAIHASERIATTLASSVIVATPFLYDHVRQMTAGKKNVVLIATGLSAIAPARDGATADLYPDRLSNHTILYIGSISKSSGHRVDMLPEILAQVHKQIPDVKLVIAGSGDNENELKKQFHDLGLEDAVDFAGRFSASDIPTLIAKAAILIDPIDASIISRAKSSFRCAVALISGMAIVTSSIGIRTDLVPEILHEKFFAIPENPTSYADHIVRLLHTPLSDEEKVILRKQAEKYTWEHLAETYKDLLI